MKIELFQAKHYSTYQSWSEDEDFDKNLGPIDREWLEYVLSDTTGVQYALLYNDVLVSVVGILLPTREQDYYTITDLAVSPLFKRQGMGSKVLNIIIDQYQDDQRSWKAFVDHTNNTAIRFFTKNGWKTDRVIDDSEMFCFEYCQEL